VATVSLKLIQTYIISSGDPLLRSRIDGIVCSKLDEDAKIGKIKEEIERHYRSVSEHRQQPDMRP
jgi:hypothetical protein